MSSIDRPKRRPARILMYTAYFEPEYSGAALQALTLAKELRMRGHEIEFVTNRWPGLSQTATVEGFSVRRLEPGRMRKHREFRLWFNLVRYAWSRRRDFDILHSHGAYFTNAFIGPLARALGLKSLIKASLADDDLQGMERPIVGTVHRLMLRSVDAYVAISQDLVKEFRAAGLQQQKIQSVPNGVDTERFRSVSGQQVRALRADLRLPAEQPIVLYVGVLDARKNILWLAEQWIAHDAFGTGALLLAVGPQGRDDPAGRLRARLAEMAHVHPQRFALHEFRADVLPYYQCASVMILPSVKEGLPNVMLEAMACSLPCVVARASGSRELIIEGKTGFTYAPEDALALGAAVQYCLSTEGAVLGRRARQIAEERYSIFAIANQYEIIFARLLRAEKKVLYVENGIGYGGAIICLRHLVRNLDRSRFEPMVITGLGDKLYQEIASEAYWKYIPDRRFNVISLKRSLNSRSWPSSLKPLRWLVNQILSRLDDLFNFLPSFLQTLWTTIRLRPDLIHVNNEPLCNRAAILTGKILNIPVIAHVRGDQQGSLLMHSLFKLPDYFIAVSRWVSESIGKIGVPARDRTYIYDGIELEALDLQADGQVFRKSHSIGENAYVVGLVGLLIPWKGQRLFLEAIKILAAEMPDAVFAIVGGTPDEFKYYESELRTLVRQSDFKARVIFTGHVSQMESVYNGLSVALSASTSPEPLGTMIIEAMTMARPIVAPGHGGAVEMIEDGKTGLLFRAGDAQDLAAKLKQLYLNPELCAALGSAARIQALKTFSIRQHVMQVEDVYKRILGMP